MRKWNYSFHPVLLSVYPVLYLYARNIAFIPMGDAVRALLMSIGVTCLFSVGFWMILKRLETAGVLCSTLVFFVFAFGHVANLQDSWFSQLAFNFPVQTFAWVWGGLFLVAFYIFLRVDFAGKSTQTLILLALAIRFAAVRCALRGRRVVIPCEEFLCQNSNGSLPRHSSGYDINTILFQIVETHCFIITP